MHLHQNISARQIQLWIIIFSIILIYSLFSWFVPFNGDDLLFQYKYTIANNGSTKFSLSGLVVFMRDLWLYENGRLANVLCGIVILWMPKWIWAISLGTIICSIFMISTKMAQHISPLSPLMLLVIWIMGIIFFPWYDMSSLMLVAYAMNYFVSMLFVIASIYIAWQLESTRVNHRIYICTLVIGIITGLMHEGFAVPLLATIILTGIISHIKKNPLSLQWYGFLIAVMVGTIICISSPAIIDRFFTLSESHEIRPADLRAYIRILLKNTPLFAGTLLAGCAMLCQSDSRRFLKRFFAHQLNIYLLLLATTSAIMDIILLAPPRATLCSTLPIIILIASIAKPYIVNINKRATTICIAGALVFIGIFYSGVIFYQARIASEDICIKQKLVESNGETVFFDITEHTPWWTFRHPVTEIWYGPMQHNIYSLTMSRNDSTALVAPSIFKNFEYSSLSPIEQSPGFYQLGRYVLTDNPSLISTEFNNTPGPKGGNLRFIFDDGRNIGSYIAFLPILGKDGKLWIIGIPSKVLPDAPYVRITNGS